MSGKKRGKRREAGRIVYWPSHNPFFRLIDFSVRGKSNPIFGASGPDDHVAEIFDLVGFDTDEYFWWGPAGSDGKKAHLILQKLEDRIFKDHDLKAAETIYAIATRAAFEVLSMYLRHRVLFDKIAPQRRILPSLFSIHPRTAAVVRQMRSASRLGTETGAARQIGSNPFFLSDKAANIYARAIINSVESNQHLDYLELQRKSWKGFDRKEGVRTVLRPLPKYIKGIKLIPVPITPENVMEYWRKGKEIILEEMPDFHERPEWKNYREKRHYDTGAKKGAIQHAIFKDILAALKTIAGANKRKTIRKAAAHDFPK